MRRLVYCCLLAALLALSAGCLQYHALRGECLGFAWVKKDGRIVMMSDWVKCPK
jgi:hypothetical protein